MCTRFFCLMKCCHWQAPCCYTLPLLFAQLVCWCAVCVIVVDVPRRRVSEGPALTCLTRRRRRTTLLALRATATSDPLFRCAVVLQNEDSQPFITTYSCITSGAQPAWLASHLFAKAGCFLLLCAALLAVLIPS